MADTPERHADFFDFISRLGGGRLFKNFNNEDNVIASFGFTVSQLRLHAFSCDDIVRKYIQISKELMQGRVPETVVILVSNWILDHLVKNDMGHSMALRTGGIHSADTSSIHTKSRPNY